MSETTCPVFRPTVEEFKNFTQYIDLIEKTGELCVCKIIPPAGFARDRNYDDAELPIVQSPIRQVVDGRNGAFTVRLYELPPMAAREFRAIDKKNAFISESYPERERKFWKSLGISWSKEDPVYGADSLGSLFGDDNDSPWCLNNLDNLLSLLGTDLPGVSIPMLYFGTWRAFFAYHVEDLNLYSINYLHTGAAKSWYCIPLKHKQLFESMATSYFAEDFHACHEFLRHKTHMFSPTKLRESGIEFQTVVQEAGEFVVTFPGR